MLRTDVVLLFRMLYSRRECACHCPGGVASGIRIALIRRSSDHLQTGPQSCGGESHSHRRDISTLPIRLRTTDLSSLRCQSAIALHCATDIYHTRHQGPRPLAMDPSGADARKARDARVGLGRDRGSPRGVPTIRIIRRLPRGQRGCTRGPTPLSWPAGLLPRAVS